MPQCTKPANQFSLSIPRPCLCLHHHHQPEQTKTTIFTNSTTHHGFTDTDKQPNPFTHPNSKSTNPWQSYLFQISIAVPSAPLTHFFTQTCSSSKHPLTNSLTQANPTAPNQFPHSRAQALGTATTQTTTTNPIQPQPTSSPCSIEASLPNFRRRFLCHVWTPRFQHRALHPQLRRQSKNAQVASALAVLSPP